MRHVLVLGAALAYAAHDELIYDAVARGRVSKVRALVGEDPARAEQRDFYGATPLHWACQLAGIIITPVNWRCTAEELDFIIRDAEASAVVYEEITAELVQHCRLAAKIQRIDVDAGRAATCSWQALCAATPVAPESRSTPDDTSVMLYTCLLYTSPSPRDYAASRMPSSA